MPEGPMRIPRTNFPPAAFGGGEQNFRPADEQAQSKEGAGLKRLKTIGERVSDPEQTNWETHFFLAPNVRFTRTPERDLQGPPAADQAEIAAAEENTSAPTVEQLREVLSTMMILQGGMDMGVSLPAPEIQPINDNTEIPAQASEPAIEPVAVKKPATTFSHLSDFAFWEVMEYAPEADANEQAIVAPPVEPIAMPSKPTETPELSIVSMYRTIDIKAQPIMQVEISVPPAPAPVLAPEPAPAARAPSWPWNRRSETAKAESAPVFVVHAPQPIPEVLIEAPSLPVVVAAPKPETSGVALSKPFKIDPVAHARKMRGDYEFPPRALLQDPPETVGFVMTQDQLERNAGLLESVLEDFGIRGEIIHVRPGPVVTLYEFEPAPGVKSSRVIGLADDIARSMSALSARVAVVPGRNVIGIELPNANRETVYFGELIDSQDFSRTGFKLPLCLGKTIGGEPVIAELAKMPHLLVAGTTGSGKSVAINTMILSLLYRLTPEECRLIMVDPKMLELSVYDGIPHLLTPVVTDPKKAVLALKWAVREMEDRYRKMSRLGVRNIDGYNMRAAQVRERGETVTQIVQTGFEKGTGEPIHESQEMDLAPMPYIVVIVDEMADLMMVAGKEIEGAIQRLAQMARAAGIHLIMATQRPSVDVITGTIKANFPTRISFQVTSKIDSRTILGEQGAEQLLGQGDMLHMAGGGRIARVHGPFVSDEEVEKVVAHLKSQGRPEYLETVTTDEEEEQGEDQDSAVFDKGDMAAEDGNDLYDKAVKVILRDKKCSTSYIQRRLGIGYNRAASLVERMEKEGLVGPANHVGKREIIRGNQDVAVDTPSSFGDE
jgi:S-DNA-T family DNA segregation ATPase FtsK/SpoIIIE